jgi:hypothetical protein
VGKDIKYKKIEFNNLNTDIDKNKIIIIDNKYMDIC